MRNHHLLYAFVSVAVAYSLQYQAQAASAGPLIKHISSFLKWTRSTTKTAQSDGDVLQFENGYVVETVAEGNEIGVVPYRIRVSEDGELFAVDESSSNIVRITPPLSQYSRARLVAGSFLGHTGHVDGKPSDARFNHPKGITMDDKGNVYVADTQNLAIRKIGDTGVTTIAGGKSNVAGYRDGPSEDAKFSNDFDVVYVRPTCSLLVIDRGNAALRQISLAQEDCDYQNSSVSTTVRPTDASSVLGYYFCWVGSINGMANANQTSAIQLVLLIDILTFVGAIIVGYATCMLQQGFGSSFFSRTQSSERDFKGQSISEKPMPPLESNKEEPGWPSFGQLLVDLSKLAFEALGCVFFRFLPSRFRSDSPRRGFTPLKDHLQIPGDDGKAPSIDRPSAPAPLTENRQVHTPSAAERYSEMKPPKIKSTSFKDPSLPSKHRSSKRHEHAESKRQEYAEFYGSSEIPPYVRSKSQKERSRHRQREKSGEVIYGPVGVEPKPVEMRTLDYSIPKFDHYNKKSGEVIHGALGAEPKPVEMRAADYSHPKFDHYNMRTKYLSDETFRFNPQ